MPMMIVEGIPVLPQTTALLDEARQIALETLKLGPPPLAPARTLRDDRGRGVLIATAAALHAALADFALRAADRWIAKAKAIPRALAAADPELAAQFEAAFATLFTSASGNAALVEGLVDVVLGRMADACVRDTVKSRRLYGGLDEPAPMISSPPHRW